jgi:hypothetical protein
MVPETRGARGTASGGKVVDSYAEYLAGLPDLSPQQAPTLWQGLVPNDAEVAHLPEMAPQPGHWRGKGEPMMYDDPVADANGTGPRSARRPAPPDEPAGDEAPPA